MTASRTSAPERRSTVSTDDGVTLATRSFGSPDAPVTVVCVHGHCLRMESWRRIRLTRRTDLQLVLYDQRGHGRSDGAAPHTYTIERLADDLDTVIRGVDPHSRIVLLGHSMGGMVVQSWVCRHAPRSGDRIAGVGLIATATHDVARAGVEQIVSSMAARAGRTAPDTVAGFLPALARHDGRPALGVLAAIPTLILCGSRDAVTPPRHSEEMADRLPNSELVRVDAGHLVVLERPDEVSAAVDRLIERICDSPAAATTRR